MIRLLHDLPLALGFWSCLVGLGLVLLPVTARVFRPFFDAGYLFSRVLGLGLVSYGVWLVASLHVFSFSRGTIGSFALALCVVVYSRSRNRETARELIRSRWKLLLVEEAVFGGVLFTWAYLRGIRPEILGLEKFMDFGFAAAALRSQYMPPQDMWLAGEPVNYYYFGHFVLALLSKLTGIRLAVAYNLMIAALAACCFSLTFSLTANLIDAWKGTTLRRAMLGGVLSAALLTFGGNLHPFVYAYAAPVLRRLDPQTEKLGPHRPYWYADATRYVGYDPPTDDRTIHEFPFYSFLVADLHAHVSNLPFVLTFLAFLAAFALTPEAGWIGFALWSGLSLAVFRMTNAWDLPIYGFIAAVVLLAVRLRREPSALRAIGLTGSTLTATLVVFGLSSAPFEMHFQNPYGELGWVRGHTPLYQLLVLWGVPATFAGLYLLLGSRAALRWLRREWGAGFRETLKRSITALPAADAIVMVLTLSAFGLVLLPEIVYLRDIYVAHFYRANTFFKLGYQAFLLFGVLIGYYAARLTVGPLALARSRVAGTAGVVLLSLPLLYAPIAIRQHYGRLHPFHFKGLDGLAYLELYRPGDGEAVKWLDEHVRGNPVILEADGHSYSDYGRISMATGLRTVLGWYVHEWLWRGDRGEADRRARDVRTVYTSPDLAKTRAILKRYGVAFIIMGELERMKFPGIDERRLETLGRVVFDSQGTKIIQTELRR